MIPSPEIRGFAPIELEQSYHRGYGQNGLNLHSHPGPVCAMTDCKRHSNHDQKQTRDCRCVITLQPQVDIEERQASYNQIGHCCHRHKPLRRKTRRCLWGCIQQLPP